MTNLTGTVGDNGANAKQDVALVQLMLRVTKNAKGVPYYGADYSGNYDVATKNAIAAFQKDNNIQTADTKTAKATEKSGRLDPTSQTLAKLNAALPAKYADMRSLPGTNIVYLPASQGAATASQVAISAKADLNPGFRMKVAAVVETMYEDHKIALEVVGPGWRRDFATQAAQTKTGAGPGESNHNFGRAVDLGFKSFTWINGAGQFVKEGGWLGSPALGNAKSTQLWNARDAIAVTGNGLFLTTFGGERVHLQNFSDGTVNGRHSLAKLLTTVGTMKWQHGNQYQADLGLGVKQVDVGTSKQIWSDASPITKDGVAAAAAGKDMTALMKSPLFAKLEAVKAAAKAVANAKPGVAVPAASAKLAAQNITANDMKVIRAALKGEFEAADANWDKWVPTP